MAVARHPPGPADGGDVARYTAANVTLRSAWGRSEAYAYVMAARHARVADDLVEPAVGPRGCLMRMRSSCRAGSGAVGRYGWSSGAR